jgi:hypothetical protein
MGHDREKFEQIIVKEFFGKKMHQTTRKYLYNCVIQSFLNHHHFI